MRTGMRACVLGMLLVLSGCASYYRVVVPSTDKVYYTQEVSRQRSGAVSFEDALTGDTVVLQASEVQEIGADRFRAETTPQTFRAAPVATSTLQVVAFHVSAAINQVSPHQHGDDAIYLLRIRGSSLDRKRMFENGINGFRYEIDLEAAPGKYKVSAYPVTGVRYTDDGLETASLIPSEIAFYWLGPKAISPGQAVKVTQFARDFEKNLDVPVGDPVVTPLPTGSRAPAGLDAWTIRFEESKAASYFNGVCTFPIRVLLTDFEGRDAPKEIYDRLVFYPKDSGGNRMEDRVVGADPSDVRANLLFVVPAAWGSDVRTPSPKYGDLDRSASAAPGRGRLFYVGASAAPGTNPLRKLEVSLVEDSGEPARMNDFQLEEKKEKVAYRSVPSAETGPNTDAKRTLSLEAVGAEGPPYLSDPTGGAFDFVFAKVSGEGHFVVPVLPEGLNQREIRGRFNFKNFKQGFHLKPDVTGGHVTGFLVYDQTSSLASTSDQAIYAYIFDVFGRYPAQPLLRDDKKKIVKMNREGAPEAPLILNWSEDGRSATTPDDGDERFMICMDNKSLLPVLFQVRGEVRDVNEKYKQKVHARTSILAGPSTETCYATADDQAFWKHTKADWFMDGQSWLKPGAALFQDELRLYRTTKNGFICMISFAKLDAGSKEKPPFGTEMEVRPSYPAGKEALVTRWVVRYRKWAGLTDHGELKGNKNWQYWVEGRKFNGTLHKDWFNQGTWDDAWWKQ